MWSRFPFNFAFTAPDEISAPRIQTGRRLGWGHFALFFVAGEEFDCGIVGGIDAGAVEDPEESEDEDFQIEPEAAIVNIPNIEANFSSQEIALRPLIWAQPVRPGLISWRRACSAL